MLHQNAGSRPQQDQRRPVRSGDRRGQLAPPPKIQSGEDDGGDLALIVQLPRGAKLTSSSVDPASAPHPLVSVQQRTDLLSFIWTSAGESGAPRRMEAPLSAIV
jgi:hypothetical protein